MIYMLVHWKPKDTDCDLEFLGEEGFYYYKKTA